MSDGLVLGGLPVDARRCAPSSTSALAYTSATLPTVSAADRRRASTARPVAHVIGERKVVFTTGCY